MLNPGVVDDAIERLEATVRADELAAASATADTVTDDDDLDPGGTVADWYPRNVTTYRTVCVRLCDGAVTPLSFATRKDRFAFDALRCRKSCNSPSRLFVQRNPGGALEAMVDLDGRSYEKLDTAFKFRTSYDGACTCRAHSWEDFAQSRHRMFEIVARVRAARQLAYDRIAALKAAGVKSARIAAAKARPSAKLGAVAPPPAVAVTETGSLTAAFEVRDGEKPAPAAIVVAKGKGKAKGGRLASGQGPMALGAGAVGKGARGKGKPKADGALVVLFGKPADLEFEAKAGPKAERRASVAMRREASARRFDGTDWRISIYEPL